mmetsp:Transcript_11173/g.24658  ORF Transcript_11173/g.24658 Transcript_11173/m.24658 type:complete len:282 (+) Transcript_11173:194-1039(+)
MYIGPWQEYKLARLIQQQQQPTPDARQQRLVVGGGRRPGSGFADDAASVASSRSGLSGTSTRSAPARLPHSAQAQLNDYCTAAERAERPLRTRPPSAGYQPRAKATGKKSSKKDKGPSLEEQRKMRIRQMQKLYGLGSSEQDEEGDHPPTDEAADRTAPAGKIYQRPPLAPTFSPHPAPPTSGSGGVGQVPFASSQEHLHFSNTSSSRGSPSPSPSLYTDFSPATQRPDDTLDGRLPSLAEDPLGITSASLNSSGGLIAWSKNLQADDLSPQATLTRFFKS